ncbi:MAG: hypothetical protein RMK73_01155 [Geminicoccaceae bacterium]|nr:hypothetical protein [Geminicoccaceae bacterium]
MSGMSEDELRRRRARNLVIAGALLALVVVFYVLTIVRISGNLG